jgi:hypothetical protein
MDKIYITKSKLENLLNQTLGHNADYPKPILTLLTVIIMLVFIAIIFVLMFIIILAVILYSIVGWIDILIGKHILKRIFKQ